MVSRELIAIYRQNSQDAECKHQCHLTICPVLYNDAISVKRVIRSNRWRHRETLAYTAVQSALNMFYGHAEIESHFYENRLRWLRHQ
jgi:hypothetical protein